MPARYALLIGNSAFRHAELARLSAPANDVRALAGLLEDPEIGGFTTELKLDVGLVDARKAIRRLFEDRHPDDLVLFYYSGHGLLDAHGRFYLAMTETDPDDPDAGSIDETWLRGVFDGSLSSRQVAILDCCHSGAFIPGEPTRKDASAGPILTERTFDPTGHGRFIMAATTATTSAFEQEGRSLYTRHLVEGLTGGAAAPENDTVSVLDLHDFVKQRVATTAPSSMRPQLWRDASLNPDAEHLAIARNLCPRPKLPEAEIGSLWSDDPKDTELAIFRLIERAKGEGSIAEDASTVLAERLKASDSLSYTLGARIADFIAPGEASKALAAAEDRASKFENKCIQAEQFSRNLERTVTQAEERNEVLVSELESEKKNARGERVQRLALESELAKAKQRGWRWLVSWQSLGVFAVSVVLAWTVVNQYLINPLTMRLEQANDKYLGVLLAKEDVETSSGREISSLQTQLNAAQDQLVDRNELINSLQSDLRDAQSSIDSMKTYLTENTALKFCGASVEDLEKPLPQARRFASFLGDPLIRDVISSTFSSKFGDFVDSDLQSGYFIEPEGFGRCSISYELSPGIQGKSVDCADVLPRMIAAINASAPCVFIRQ